MRRSASGLVVAMGHLRTGGGVPVVANVRARSRRDRWRRARGSIQVRARDLARWLNQALERWSPSPEARAYRTPSGRGLVARRSLINDPAEAERCFAAGGERIESDEPVCFRGPLPSAIQLLSARIEHDVKMAPYRTYQ
jgi:hypothetical protein